SSPGSPHPFHMQAHLATRLGRWDKTADRSSRAIELEREYHKFQNVKPSEDFQFTHHLEILTISLVHDGRYAEARKIKAEAEKAGYSHWMPWFRLHLGERDWKEVNKVIEHHRKRDKTTASGLAALGSGRWSVAEEALLEALAHDPGSVRAALGLEAMCRRQGRTAEADRYAALAKKFWKKADLEAFLGLKDEIAKMTPAQP